jgi:thiol-disulfide isomerase/thioredoxin
MRGNKGDHRNQWLMIAAIVGIGLCGCETAHESTPPVTHPSEIVTTILTPDGKPASGALAVLVPPGHEADVSDGEKFDDDPAYQRCTAGEDGRIRFRATNQLYLIVAIHPSGSACFDQIPRDGSVRLQAWGRIEGRLFKGDRPDTNQKMSIWQLLNDTTAGMEKPNAMFEAEVQTDSDGKFAVPRMAAEKTNVAPDYQFSWGELQRPLVLVDVKPGKTATVTLGGQGRPVIGSIAMPPSLMGRKDVRFSMCMIGAKKNAPTAAMPENVQHASLAEQAKWWESFEKSDAGKKFEAAKEEDWETDWATTHGFDVQPDGTFRIEDVTAGEYALDFDLVEKHEANQPRKRLAYAQTTFTVPSMSGGRSDEALTIPTVQVQLLSEIKVGDVVPDFVVKGLDDQPLRLEFWATWCGPCVAQTDRLKQIYQTFGSDRRFAMISLSLDPRPDDPIRYVAQHGIPWHEGFLGDWDHATVAQNYHVEGIPSFWLIGADGTLLAQPRFSGEDLQPDIAKALGK